MLRLDRNHLCPLLDLNIVLFVPRCNTFLKIFLKWRTGAQMYKKKVAKKKGSKFYIFFEYLSVDASTEKFQNQGTFTKNLSTSWRF